MSAQSEGRDSLPSQHFFPRFYGVDEWTDHLHFAYDLIAQFKPEVFAEVGTDRGESYFAFCQSVQENRTSSRCYAVTPLRHAGGNCDDTFNRLSSYNQENYWSFSHLLRSDPDDALPFFGDQSIDLLHIDGLDSETTARLTLDRWLPKLRQGGILLLHDVIVRSRGFGVWMVWGELSAQGKSYVFEDGAGLGVWQKPSAWATPPMLRTLFAHGPEQEELANYYTGRANELHSRIAEHWRDGTIRETPAAQQTTIQVFLPTAGVHREQDSIRFRVAHNEWVELEVPVPANSCNGPLRIDFISAYTYIDITEIELREEADADSVYYRAFTSDDFKAVVVSGDAKRLPLAPHLRLEVTGIDPQLHLPPPQHTGSHPALCLRLRLRVSTDGFHAVVDLAGAQDSVDSKS